MLGKSGHFVISHSVASTALKVNHPHIHVVQALLFFKSKMVSFYFQINSNLPSSNCQEKAVLSADRRKILLRESWLTFAMESLVPPSASNQGGA